MARRYFIVVGDTTTAGGAVLTGAPFLTIQSLSGDPRQQAFVGDQVECADCGLTRIVSGVSHATFNGCEAAIEGSELACGHKLVSTQQRLSWTEEEASARSVAQSYGQESHPPAADAHFAGPGRYDEAFILTSKETGKPLANRRYRIVRGELVESGVTDASGATHVVLSETGEGLEIFIQEEGP